MDSTDVTSAARKTGDHPLVEKGARVGYAMSGIIHFIIGWIALKLAWGIGGGGSSDANTSGALRTVASSGAGPIMLGIAVVGFLMLAVAMGAAAVVGSQGGEARRPHQVRCQGRDVRGLCVDLLRHRPRLVEL